MGSPSVVSEQVLWVIVWGEKCVHHIGFQHISLGETVLRFMSQPVAGESGSAIVYPRVGLFRYSPALTYTSPTVCRLFEPLTWVPDSSVTCAYLLFENSSMGSVKNVF